MVLFYILCDKVGTGAAIYYFVVLQVLCLHMFSCFRITAIVLVKSFVLCILPLIAGCVSYGLKIEG